MVYHANQMSIVFLSIFLLHYKTLRGDFPTIIEMQFYPLILCLYMFVKLGHSVQWSLDHPIINGIKQCLLAPRYKVTFLAGFIGDWICSLCKVLIDLAYIACFVSSGRWATHLHVHAQSCFDHELFKYVITPCLLAFPLWMRMMQTLRQTHDTRKRLPYLGNTFKYALSHTVVIFGVLHNKFMREDMQFYHSLWLLSMLTSTLYSYYWDIYMDWGLGDPKYNMLRPRHELLYSHFLPRIFPTNTFYYLCMAYDLFGRFTWTITLIPHQLGSPLSPEFMCVLAPVLAGAEIGRRAMWSLLRLEKEQISLLKSRHRHLNSSLPARPHALSFTSIPFVSSSGKPDTGVSVSESSPLTLLLCSCLRPSFVARRINANTIEAIIITVFVGSLGLIAFSSHFAAAG